MTRFGQVNFASITPWHPEHIAERYGLFTIIVLGETILSSSIAFQAVVDDHNADATVVLTAIGALLTVFSMWWLYFAKPAAESLVSNRIGFHRSRAFAFTIAVALVVGATFTGQPVLMTGIVLVGLVAAMLTLTARSPSPSG